MLLDIQGLIKRFGGLTAVSNVSFGIERGEIVGIFGPNGSGKTTTLNLIAGILQPTEGSILWKGNEIGRLTSFEVAQQGLVKTFQNPQLFPELTVAQHMRIACHLHIKRALGFGRVWTLLRGTPGDLDAVLTRKIDQMLELCRLADKRGEVAGALSYGSERCSGWPWEWSASPSCCCWTNQHRASVTTKSPISMQCCVICERTGSRCASSITRSAF